MDISNILIQKGIDHLHYIAPLGTVKLIAVWGILSYNEQKSLVNSPKHAKMMEHLSVKSIADPHVQFRRHNKLIKEKKSLHDYVPLYFGINTPMQYVVTRNNRESQERIIVFVELDVKRIFSMPGVLYTDGNAASSDTNIYDDEDGINAIDWRIVLYEKRCYSSEYKRKKCAEVLVPNMVPPTCIKRFLFLTEEVRRDFIRWIDFCVQKRITASVPVTDCDRSHFYDSSLTPISSKVDHKTVVVVEDDEDDIPF